jgi:hypothetical protein
MTRLPHLIMGTLLMIAGAGCGAPAAPHRVNAYLPKCLPVVGIGLEAAEKADTLVLAQCAHSEEYATILEGKWVNSWYVTQWKVLRVERGEWVQPTVTFVFLDRWLAPKLGAPALNKTPVPYYVGAVRAFCIETKGKAIIVADQSRSRIPPYGPVTRPTYDMSNPEVPEMYNKITNAAKAFVWNQRHVMGPVNVTEQYGRLYVAEMDTGSQSIAVVVDADNVSVQWADPSDVTK